MKSCPQCGSLNDESVDFCSLCLKSMRDSGSDCPHDLSGRTQAEIIETCATCVTRFTCGESLHLEGSGPVMDRAPEDTPSSDNSFERGGRAGRDDGTEAERSSLSERLAADGLGLGPPTQRKLDPFDGARSGGPASHWGQMLGYVIVAIIMGLLYFSELRPILSMF